MKKFKHLKNAFDWMTWGLSVGLEQNDMPLRAGAMLCLFRDKNSFVGLIEKGFGDENYWYNLIAWREINNDFKLDLRAWRYTGIGPILQFNIVNTVFNLWFMPAYDLEKKKQNFVFGVNYNI